MSGVDMVDNFVAKYRIATKGKEWWWPLFINYVDIAMCNAWSQHHRVHGNGMDLLVRRRVAISLLATKPPGPDEESADQERDNSPLHGSPSKLIHVATLTRTTSSQSFCLLPENCW
jgi:hypothetical protein